MGYADSLLTEGEYIVYRTRQHPLARLVGARWGIVLAGAGLGVAILFLLAGWPGGTLGQILAWAVLAALLAGGLLIAWAYVGWYNEDYMITSRRVIHLGGILNKTTADSSLEKINDAVLTQSVLGRVLDWGDLRILTASDIMDVDFEMLHHALEFKKVMLMTKHDLDAGLDRRMDGRRSSAPAADAAPAPVAASPAPAVASEAPAAPPRQPLEEKLRTLAKLRDDGIITPEDYEAKKADLLAQM